MAVVIFDPRQSTDDGLVAIGGSLDILTLQSAYRSGVFPWPQEGMPMLWFSPQSRGVIDFAELHIPKSLKKFRRKHNDLIITHNACFEIVIDECQQQARKGQQGTWILPEMKAAYIKLHRAGMAHSIEVWQREQLVGGIYGVLSSQNTAKYTAKYFSGESMFYKIDNASKIALLELIEWLKSIGLSWLDIQMVTDTTSALGGKLIPREEFLRRIGV